MVHWNSTAWLGLSFTLQRSSEKDPLEDIRPLHGDMGKIKKKQQVRFVWVEDSEDDREEGEKDTLRSGQQQLGG